MLALIIFFSSLSNCITTAISHLASLYMNLSTLIMIVIITSHIVPVMHKLKHVIYKIKKSRLDERSGYYNLCK